MLYVQPLPTQHFVLGVGEGLLVYLHEHATNVEVRERAFVGWAFSLKRLDFNVYPELRKEISDHCQNHVQELIELQRHVICCINADRDNETRLH